MEYGWEVSIDVDNDRETGNGFEYELSASHFVPPSEKGSNTRAPIESKVEASVLKAQPGSFRWIIDASFEVSPEEDTITLSGYISGITAESRLAFKTYEYFGSSDEVGCRAPRVQAQPPANVRMTNPQLRRAKLQLTTSLMFLPRTLSKSARPFRRDPDRRIPIQGYSGDADIQQNRDLGELDGVHVGGVSRRGRRPGDRRRRFEYLLSAYHIVRPAEEGDNTGIRGGDQFWERQSGGGISTPRGAKLAVRQRRTR